MHLPFDILKKERDGSFRWFEAVNDLGSANIRIREIIALSPGDYIVFDQRTHNTILPAPSSCRVDSRRERRLREPHLVLRQREHTEHLV
jgi:hypothetical protein